VDRHDTTVGYEIDTAGDRDVRRDVAREIVTRGWGLLELRPMRVSLEEVFLQVTTEERPTEPALSEDAARVEGPAPSEGEARVEGEAPRA
jgi:ABC-2 type transport system ATP-binding protein